MEDRNKANMVGDANDSNGDEISLFLNVNEVSWDKYIVLLEDKLQKAAVRDEYEAYHLYCEYAHAMGFSVRKGKHDYFSGTTKMRSKLFTCSKEGLKDVRIDKKGNCLHPSSTERSGCLARIWFTRRIDGLFKVTKWVKEHNHEMAGLNQRHLLRSAKSTGLIHGNLLESHVSGDVDPYNMGVEDSNSMMHYSSESEMIWCNQIMRKAHDLIMLSRGNMEARKIVEKALEDAHEKVRVILENQDFDESSSKDGMNNVIGDNGVEVGVDPPPPPPHHHHHHHVCVKSKGVSKRTRVHQNHWKRERHRKIIQRARSRKKWRKIKAGKNSQVVELQHINNVFSLETNPLSLHHLFNSSF